ncbi:Spy0128 family protein [Collinsella aerofaciens]|uniref:Spy0128 family protein n=1 Tax=Collinsella aerofaciens TaxID=74426 RepID=UPI0034A31A15
MSKYTRGLLAVILAVVLVLPATAFAMLPEANARSSTGMDGPAMTGKTVVDPDTGNYWKFWAGGYDGKEVTTQNVGRIWTDKTVKETAANEESDFLTTLSAISSTSDTTVSGKPLDIVLVLDASGSMSDPMVKGDRTKRIDALKTAANRFIDTIATQNQSITDESKQHQVAIVKFAGDKTTEVGNKKYRDSWGDTYNYSQTMKNLTPCKDKGAESLKSTVNSISPDGSTRADYGLELADEQFSFGRADAKKIVVFFTDGSPTSSSGFQASVANSAINSAKSLKNKGADIYTIGIFDGANPSADLTADGTSKENKFMHAVSSNYPAASSSISFWGEWTINFGARAENANYYKSATSAAELEEIFKDISGSIIQAGYPTKTHSGYGEHKSGYITFTDELGDFMRVDNFTSVVYNGETFAKPAIKNEGNVDTYKFTGAAANLVITVQHAEKSKPRTGDIVTVKIPASLIPLRHFKITDGVLTVDDTEPIRVNYTSSVKRDALDNLFTPEKVAGLKGYIESNTITAENGSKTVNFYANKWNAGALGDTIANFEPADTNRYYYFQKQTPIYVDEDCTQPAKDSLAADGIYYYKDEFEAKGADGKAESRTAVIEFTGGRAAGFKGAVVSDASGNLSFSKGTARLAFIDELHTTKERVGGNPTGTATDVLNPKWNNMSAKPNATEVDVHLGNNGKISFNVTPTTVDTKAGFGLTKVLEGREWTDADEFKFELSATSENDAPMPASATVTVTNDDLSEEGKAAINFGEITYNKPGEYTYEVREVKGDAGGITYSKNVATFKVTVTVNAKGELKADVEKTSGETKFTNTYSAKTETPLTLEATKTLTGRLMADGEFKFTLSYAGHDEVLLNATNKSGKVEFGPLTYTTKSLVKLVEEDKASFDDSSDKPTWTIRYTAAEQIGKLPAGVSATVSAIDACVTVVDNGDGTLTATAVYGDAGNEFVNTYTAAPVEASLVGKKNLLVPNGLTPADITGKFTFTVTGEEGAPMPANASVTNDAKGKVDFGKITFTLDDLNKALGKKPEKREHTFTYTVTESGEVAGVTNDVEPSRTVSFTVTDDGEGNLRVSSKSDGNAAFTFTNTYNVTPVETHVTDEIKATKVLTGRDLKEGEFSFELVEGNDVVATGTNAADGKITMGAVKYAEAGKHAYTLREVNGGITSKGITYSDAKYTIETTITDKGDGTLEAKHVLKGDEPAEFKNTYSVTPLDAELDFDLSKAIDGRDWTDADEFGFTITAPEGTPLPDPATVTVSKKDAEDGIAAIKFGKIRYTAAGTYKYEIRENAGNAAGMTYDGHVATAEVIVTEDGEGKLLASVTKKENGRFTNTYRSELDYAAAGGLKLSKSLSGRPMTEGLFTFTVTPADEASAKALGLLPGANNFKSPATAEATVGLIDILAGHEVKFTQADAGKTFAYTVSEKNDGKPGYTYDDAERTVTIAIADDGASTLTATTTVSGGPEGTLVTEYKTGAAAVESAVVPFVNSYSATTNTPGGTAAQVVAAKTLTGRPMVDGEFWFGIAYQGELVGYENLKPNIGGHVSFDALHYDTKMLANLEAAGLAHRTDKDGKLAWTINYIAYEAINGLPNGVSATTWYFGFKVIVVDNGDGILTATVDYGGVEPLFENVYGADAVDAALAGTKKLQAAEGLTPADITGKFTFTVTADEAGAPMPERATATNDEVGNVDFGKIHFTLEDLNRALGVTTDASDDVPSDAEANADKAEVDADENAANENDAEVDGDESDANDESEPAAPTAPRSHTFTYTVTESGSAPGVTNDASATRKVSYTVTDDGAGHLKVVREGDDGAAFTFTNTYSVTPIDSSVTDQVKTVKRLTGRDLAAGEFTFELLEDGVVVATGTNDANGTVALSPIRYEAPGAHTYMLREACPNALGLYKGVTYDGTTYTVVTTVSDNGDGTLTATHKIEGTTESAGFTNKYHAMPTQVSIGAIKVLEGRELKKDEFSFKLVGEDIESTVTNDADGKINFDKFEYDEPGTYVYTISEVKGDEAGMTYDKSVFTATVNVADDGEGNLKANVAFTKGDKSVEGIVFNNTYKKPETPVPTPDPGTPKTVTNIVKTVKGFLPTTGDQQAAALLMAFVIAMAGVGALVWGIRKR